MDTAWIVFIIATLFCATTAQDDDHLSCSGDYCGCLNQKCSSQEHCCAPSLAVPATCHDNYVAVRRTGQAADCWGHDYGAYTCCPEGSNATETALLVAGFKWLGQSGCREWGHPEDGWNVDDDCCAGRKQMACADGYFLEPTDNVCYDGCGGDKAYDYRCKACVHGNTTCQGGTLEDAEHFYCSHEDYDWDYDEDYDEDNDEVLGLLVLVIVVIFTGIGFGFFLGNYRKRAYILPVDEPALEEQSEVAQAPCYVVDEKSILSRNQSN